MAPMTPKYGLLRMRMISESSILLAHPKITGFSSPSIMLEGLHASTTAVIISMTRCHRLSILVLTSNPACVAQDYFFC